VPAVTAHRLGRWSRLAAIAGIPVVGATLLFVVWSAVATIRSASTTTLRGEADALHTALRSELFAPGDTRRDVRLAAALDNLADRGLRYVALIDRSGEILDQAGTSVQDPDELVRFARLAPLGAPERIGDRVRVVYSRVLRRQRDRPAMVIELVPRVADQLSATARWLLIAGALVALVLTGLAAVLVRWSLGREHAVRAAEQARRLAMLGQVSAVLAHEIRNPLASLKGNAQLLAMALPDGDRNRAKADRVVVEASRLETLSNDLLEFARDGELRLDDVDPAALVRDAALAISSGGEPGRVELEADGAPRTWRLDRDKIRSVLVNLLENAAAISEGPITVRVARDGRHLALSVRDRGPGIPAGDLGHVFEPFFTRRERGTGLGLAIAKRLVELHGGSIIASNAPDGGAIFRVALPRAR